MKDARSRDRRRRPRRAALRRDAAPPRLRGAGADRLRRGRAALRPAAAVQGACSPAPLPERLGRPTGPPAWYEENGGRAAARGRAAAASTRGATRSSSTPATRARLRQAADRDRRRAAAAAASSRATRTSTACAPSPTPGACAPSSRPGRRLAIVGAGFIGQEVAATARGLGVEVTIDRGAADAAGADPRRASSAAGSPTSTATRACGVLHRRDRSSGARGNGARRGARPRRRQRGRVRRRPRRRSAPSPATAWLAGSGLEPTAGCTVDAAGRTGLPGRLRRRRRLASPSTPASALTPAPSTGTPPPGRGRPPRRRCSASIPGRRRCRASGATSTGSGSSTSATPTTPTRSRIEGDPGGRDFEAVFTRGGVPVAGAGGRPAACDPRACASESSAGTGPPLRTERR